MKGNYGLTYYKIFMLHHVTTRGQLSSNRKKNVVERPDLVGSIDDKRRPDPTISVGDKPPHAFQRRLKHHWDGG